MLPLNLSHRIGLRHMSRIGKVKICRPLTNEGFEMADFTGWTVENIGGEPVVDNTNPHSGTYSAHFEGYPTCGAISQTISPAIPKSDIASFICWSYSEYSFPFSSGFIGTLTYDDDTTTEFNIPEFYDQWCQFDFLSVMEDKSIKRIRFYFGSGTMLNGWVDDVNLRCE